MEQEIRSLTAQVELRDDDNKPVISGYPVVFGKPSQDLGGFIEFIDKRALDKVDLSHVLLLYGHDPNLPLARADAGTLKLKVDKKGLYFESELPRTTLASDMLENIRFGNIRGMSFGFTVAKDSWDMSKKVDVRTIEQIDQLFEITITPLPAYQDTSVAISSRDATAKTYTKRARNHDFLELAQIQLGGMINEH
ncbi:MAG: HK97 family phage prohead protease [Lactobacillaceae bacterium]|jgi:HK97 family phage prohead protease|nr:HK97 family phage prohead protease [Lactobacillaceae bacterium]